MSELQEPVVEPVVDSVVDSAEKKDEPSSLTVAHLNEYPTVHAAYDYATSFPIVQRVSSFTSPYVSAAKECSQPLLKHASPVLARADQLGDRVLSNVDARLGDALKTTKPSDVLDLAKKPIVTLKSAVEAYKVAATTAAQDRVVKPLQNASDAVVERSKPVIDPLLKPVNERFETMINNYLPKEETEKESEATPEASTNELGRTVELAVTAVKRAKPALYSQANTTKTYVQGVYDEKHEQYAKGTTGVQTTVYASIATARQLTTEGVALAGSVLQKPEIKSV